MARDAWGDSQGQPAEGCRELLSPRLDQLLDAARPLFGLHRDPPVLGGLLPNRQCPLRLHDWSQLSQPSFPAPLHTPMCPQQHTHAAVNVATLMCQPILSLMSQRRPCALLPLRIQTGPTATVYLTLFGVILGFVSTLWAFRYTRMGRSIKMYLEAKEGEAPGVGHEEGEEDQQARGTVAEGAAASDA